jgi:uncharacterized paraquat-inducible protein A
MDAGNTPDRGLWRWNEEWTAERVARAMWLPYGVAGRTPEELQTCPHCDRTYYWSNGGACPRCGGPVPAEPPQATRLHFGLM